MTMVQLPVGSTLEQTEEVVREGPNTTSWWTRRTRWRRAWPSRASVSPAEARTRA